MKRFIGREKELLQLENLYRKPGFQMAVIYGRRRIGKTTLLNQFVDEKSNIFYMAARTTAEDNLKSLSQVIGEKAGMQETEFSFSDFPAAFHAITSIGSSDEKLVIVFDEYPYLLETVSGISSVLSRTIDLEWSHKNIMLILCGSSISMMEDEVLSEKSPLYGRRTGQMDVKPFDYLTSSEFTPDYTSEEKAIAYGVTGGIPKYLDMLDPGKGIHENIADLFFDDSGYFYEEPQNLLQQEFRNVATYNAIIGAIAEGAVSISEISQRTHMDSSQVSQALRRLIRIRIVRKDEPVPPQKNKRYSQYVLCDGMFRFWYRYVSKALNVIERGAGAEFYNARIIPVIHDYMGLEFETMCREYLWNHMQDLQGELFLSDVGKWRGNDNRKHEPADIDVVGIDNMEKKAVIGECKFRNEKSGLGELKTLKERAGLIAPYQVKKYYLFSLSGFKEELQNTDKDTLLVSLKDMYV